MDAALILVRAIHVAAQLSLTGTFAFVWLVATPAYDGAVAPRLTRILTRLALWSLGIAALSALPWLALVGRGMSGGTLSPGVIATVLTQTQFGHALVLRLVGLALLVPLAMRVGRGRGLAGFVLSVLVVAGIAFQGHAGADLGWNAIWHLAADGLHLIVAAMWLGALIPLALLFAQTRRDGTDAVARYAASRFSSLGIFCVAALFVTGTVNAWFLVGSIAALIGTSYGQLLVLKIVVFAVMLAVAAINRTILMTHGDTKRIARNALIEAALGFCIVAIVAALGTLPPAAHEPVGWPFVRVVTSPVPFAAVPIDAGAKLYAQNCASCHGADGPKSSSDGDLFDLIGAGRGAMPGFAQLSDTERWSLVHFLKAQQAGIASASMGAGVTVMAAPEAPDFSFTAPSDAPRSLRAVLENGPVLLAFDDDPAAPRLAQLEASRPDLAGEGIFLLTLPGIDPARAAYALYERTIQRDAGPAAPHIEFLIDRDGLIRARWRPGDLPDWRDPAALAREVESLARLKPASLRATSHLHEGD